MTEKITLTHLNIRQSIAILLSKLVVTDIVTAVAIISLYFLLVQGGPFTEFAASNIFVFLIILSIGGLLKIGFNFYIVLQWLNEYYEITPENVIHKKGIIFKKTEIYELQKVRSIDVQDTLLGELFNFATITLYDLRLKKYLDMYLIHNPQRYAKVLKTLLPQLEIKEDRVFIPFIPKKEKIEAEFDD